MRIDVNLASQPYEDLRRFWFRWGGALAALGILTLVLLYVTAMGWMSARKDEALIHQAERQIASRDQEKVNAQALLNQPQNVSTRDRSVFLNDLFFRKAFSWTKVFEDLEQVMPPGLHVVSIRPELAPDEVEIKLVVAGESRDRALELVRKMEASQRFQQTQIEEETSENGAGATEGDTVLFNISTLYVSEMEAAAQSRSTP